MFVQLHTRGHGYDNREHKQREDEGADPDPEVDRRVEVVVAVVAGEQVVQEEQVDRGGDKEQQ